MKLHSVLCIACGLLTTFTASALKPSEMNDYACCQLKGKVKTVRTKSKQYNQDNTSTFDASGRLISVRDNNDPSDSRKYIYTSATRYSIKYQNSKHSEKMAIKYTALSRTDRTINNVESLPEMTYTFNKFGQLIEYKYQSPEFYVFTLTYNYEKPTDIVPSSQMESGGEGGEGFDGGVAYTYDEFDSHGNWTKRTCKSISVSWEDTYVTDTESVEWVETRTITYY
ncbi:MAG: hypothetical protein NC111_04355 [Bacteroides sp.]|nr:hypothetical protein [Bacteroides sp.]MCM1413036.1 hypothetical protein [Bacteroides sp.]MCM1471742.1 hypothetical protein [Bacteroides sp.]